MEVLFQQLVFTHVLRVRVNTASTKKTNKVEQGAESVGLAEVANGAASPGNSKQKIGAETGNINNLLTVDVNNIIGAINIQPRESPISSLSASLT